MKKLISILLGLCLMLMPMDTMAVDSAQTVASITNSNDAIQTTIEDSNISITHAPGSPEAQSIERILAHKRANGEDVTAQPKSQAQGLVNGGIYYIKNYFSGKYLNVHYGVDANGTNVYQWTGDSSKEQKFKIVYHAATDSYKIYAMCSSNGTNRVLDVVRNGSPLASGQNVDIWTPVDHTAQRLRLTYLIDDLYHIHMLGNKDLYFTTRDKSNGTSGGTSATSAGNVYLSTYSVDLNHHWQFIPISTNTSYAAPYGWLDEVNSNGIRGWAWCEDLPNTALKVEIILYNSNKGRSYTIPLTANIYRADVAQAGFGNGYHGFHYDIDWSQYPAGSYTVRVFAGIDIPDTEIHDSPMIYENYKNAILVGVPDNDGGNHNHSTGLISASPYIMSSEYYVANVYHRDVDREEINDYLDDNENSIFVFRGHGTMVPKAYGGVSYTGILLNDAMEGVISPQFYYSNVMSQNDLSNMELVMFVACKTGAGGAGANNLPTAAVERGAKVAIGFTDNIDCDKSNKWTERFFYLASQDKTISNIIATLCADTTNEFANYNMSIENVVICGDANYRLNGFR